MRWTIERLRLAIILAAALLLISIVGSIFYGRWRLRRATQDLPATSWNPDPANHAGICPVEDRTGSQNLHTACRPSYRLQDRWTGHAARCRNRHVPSADNVADTIAGKDFEYDRDSQIVIAQGESHIVLHAPQRFGRIVRDPQVHSDTSPRTDWFSIKRPARRPAAAKWIFSLVDSSGHAIGAELRFETRAPAAAIAGGLDDRDAESSGRGACIPGHL